ncbi:hypothetical protein A7U60_g8973 [Sanghuangporus baumii]|uniref:Uncharacterized protein n=1 Tax=Sanghuangporus baumii TaxID=108892 RepID=A0A9Q5HQU8_SANBA|nr:hypothetical protein A7U60_g8973 [Sanghuangporus baumii]
MDAVVPASPSSLSSDNSDSDGVNTSSAKIYFGKFQTPEKKLAALVDSAVPSVQPNALNTSTAGSSSLRRSPRLSLSTARQDMDDSAAEQSEQEEDDEDEREDSSLENRGSEIQKGSWQNPPFLEFLRKDEPSSAIASRIMRAHDNPSPPPKSLRRSLSSRSSSNLISPGALPFAHGSAESSDDAVELLLESNDTFPNSLTPPPVASDMTSLPTPTIKRQSTRSPTPRALNDAWSSQIIQGDGEPDLISFDRSVLISPPVGIEVHSPSPQHPQQLTIDDLLFSSPPQVSALKEESRDNEGSPAITPGSSLLPDCASRTQSSRQQTPPIDALGEAAEEPGVDVQKDEADTTSRTPDRRGDRSGLDQEVDQMTPTVRLPIPASSPSLRRSPRLSSLPDATLQATPRPFASGRLSRPRTPKTEGYQGRKRRREGSGRPTRMSLTPRRGGWPSESDGSCTETELFQSPSKWKRDRKRIKRTTDSSSDAVDSRLAESLSPGSALILTSLVSSESLASTAKSSNEAIPPSTPRKHESTSSNEDHDMKSPTKSLLPPISSTVQRPPPGTFRPSVLTPARGNPARPHLAPPSPLKMTLTPASRDDPNRTPARRIPVKDVDNHASLNQPNGVRPPAPVFSRPVFSRPVFSRPPADHSTAKQALPPKQALPSEPTSKVFTLRPRDRPFPQASSSSRSRSVSVESPDIKARPDEQKEAVLVPAPNEMSTDASSSSQSGLSDPSTKRASPPPVKTPTPPDPSKSAQKVESRIPRPGASTKPSSAHRSKLPMPSAKRSNGQLVTPAPSRLPPPKKAPLSRVARLGSNSASSSDDSGSSQSGPSSAVPPRKALASALAKRKRDAEKPAAPQQMIKMRQVIPGMHGGIPKSVSQNTTEKAPSAQEPEPEPEKPNARRPIIKPRRVVKGTLGDFELKTASSKTLEAISEKLARERAEQERIKQEMQKESSPPAPSLETFSFECAVPNEQKEEKMDVDPAAVPAAATSPDSLPTSDDVPDVEMAPQPDQGSENETGSRRSSRARRVPSTDVSGTASAANVPGQRNSRGKVGPPRRRGSTLPPNLLFSSNGLALKTLTNNNTTRNQNYHAQLEMHIVRKAGEQRPESPTMKLRTITEKQKEDQDKMRAERARRRRGESDASELEGHAGAQPSKHRRGPGDEEDYETPVRRNDGRKAVKWDRGLEVSVFLDEIEVHPKKYRAREGASAPRKGCLVPTPNQKPLDGLGNPLDVDAPLDVAPEKVVVTKFIYDNDEEAVLFDPPAPKTTRSKSKKK